MDRKWISLLVFAAVAGIVGCNDDKADTTATKATQAAHDAAKSGDQEAVAPQADAAAQHNTAESQATTDQADAAHDHDAAKSSDDEATAPQADAAQHNTAESQATTDQADAAHNHDVAKSSDDEAAAPQANAAQPNTAESQATTDQADAAHDHDAAKSSDDEAAAPQADTQERVHHTSAFLPLRYLEGRDYQRIATTIDNAEAPKIIEFFWYGCPHCFDIHEPLQTWIEDGKSAAVAIEEVPAMPSERWATGGQLYYTAQVLGMNIDAQVFDQVHNQRNSAIIFDEDKAKSFLVSQGADKAAVEKAWNSFGVKQKMARAEKLFHDSGLNGVPTFVVNGAYEVPFTGEYEAFFPRLEGIAQSTQTQ